MIKAYKFALDPTPEQEEMFNSHAGAARFCFNKVLEWADASYKAGEGKSPNHGTLRRAWYDNRDEWAVNQETGEIWWSKNSKQVYDMACMNAATAYTKFFKKLSKFPNKKSKRRNKPSFQFAEQVKLVGFHHIRLPKIGAVKTHESLRKLVAKGDFTIKTTTVSQNAAGRWFVAMVVHLEDEKYDAPTGPVVGIDLGLKTLAVVSTVDGVVWEEPNAKHLRSAQVKLRRAQKALSRSQKNSARREKKRKKVARIHVRVSNLRRDQINKFTTAVAEKYPVVVVEDLNVSGMTKNRRLARSISDAGWGEIRRQLSYKVDCLVVVDRFFASSKTCSDCGSVKAKLLLSERQYVCSECGSIQDRDANAARNLALVGSNLSSTAVGYTVTGRGVGSSGSPSGSETTNDETSNPNRITLDSNAQISNEKDVSNNVQ